MREYGIEEAIKLISYRSGRDAAGKNAILAMKKQLNTGNVRFFAKQLSIPVRRFMKKEGISASEVAFCYIPRGAKNTRKYGFDQSEQLCRMLSKFCGTQAWNLFYRVGKRDREQKKLTAEERAANTSGRFAVDHSALRKINANIKYLFLVDDVITTGSSFCGCAEAISPLFAGKVVAIALAQTGGGV